MARQYGENQAKNQNTEWERLLASNSKTPTVYFFNSKNCSFCEAAKPYIDDLERKYKSSGVEVVSIDVDSHPDLASAADVGSWPQYKFAVEGRVVGQDEGWEDVQRWVLEDRLGLIRKYQVQPGLLVSNEELAALGWEKQDWYIERQRIASGQNSNAANKEAAQKDAQLGSCGDSAYQTAEIAQGIQEMFDELERKIEIMNRATQTHIDGVRTTVDVRLDEYERVFGGKKCDCGKK
jgi:thiol-disulfide isomerase/thioredoxin